MENKVAKTKAVQTVNKIKKAQTIKRYIHYYEFLIGYRRDYEDKTNEAFMDLLRAIIADNQQKTPSRFFVYDGKTFCIQGLTVRGQEKVAFGKLCTIRSEDFPQMFNMRNDSIRDLDAQEFEGIVEYSHFVINYGPNLKRVGIEYNQYGGKILDLCRYFSFIGSNHGITEGVGQKNIIHNDLSKLKEKIGRISKFSAKAYSNNIDSIRNMEPGLGSLFPAAAETFNMQDVKVEYKFDYSHNTTSSMIRKTVTELINKFKKNPLQADLFLQLTVDAENTERNNHIEAFDLLADKVRSELRATKDGKNRTVVSNELLNNMIVEMKKLKL